MKVSRISPNLTWLTFIIIFLAFTLRIYHLSTLMPFIGDQGWFYLSARDMLLHGIVPLVGITSSHTWLHQGPYWTYILAGIFALTHFNPLVPAYITALVDSCTIWLFYIIGRKFLTEKVGIFAGLLYAFSPLAIVYSRMPYHTTLIPFTTSLFFLSIYFWVDRGPRYFPLVIALLIILYNFELATVVFVIAVLVLFIFGVWKKQSWTQIWNKNIILQSLFLGLLLLLPILLYDTSHGFKQTIIFGGWTAVQLVSTPLHIFSRHATGMSTFLFTSMQRIIYMPSVIFAGMLLFFSVLYLSFFVLNNRKKINHALLLYFLFVVIFSVATNGTSSEAYLPMAFPFIFLAIGAFLWEMMTRSRIAGSIILACVLFGNIFSLLSHNYLIGEKGGYGPSFTARVHAVKQILSEVSNARYTIVGKGQGSQFGSFTMNYEYLGWWLGNEPLKNSSNIFVISESNNSVKVGKKR